MNSKPSIRCFLATTLTLGVALMLGGNPGLLGHEVLAQNPQPPLTKINPFPRVSVVPLVILNVGLDNVAQPVFSPTGASRPASEFLIPRNGSKEFTVTTSGGGEPTAHFLDSVPAGVPANAFQWVQNEVPAGNAIGRLRYSGCPGCPASFNLDIGAVSRDSVHTVVKINLTVSSGHPVVNSITEDDNGVVDGEIRPRFLIKFERSTFNPEDSQVIATYASGVRYRLIPNMLPGPGPGTMDVRIPRLEAGRSVKVSLVNEYGSVNSTVTLPAQLNENPPFSTVNTSIVSNPVLPTDRQFSVRHSNSGLLAIDGTDDNPIQPLATASACDRPDFIYTGAKVTWLDASGLHPTSEFGTVKITAQPPVNALLRAPNNKIRVSWTLNGLHVDTWYNVAFSGVAVVGICSDRVIH